MGKRSDFDRVERDYYQTPFEAVKPLFPFLPKGKFTFAEPCAGDGRLVRHIREGTDRKAQCMLASDIQPDADWVQELDAFEINDFHLSDTDVIITNPPWDRRKATGQILHRIIAHFSALKPTWLLFDSDWVQTVQAKPYLELMLATVSIGRVKWIEGTNMAGKDNCQWHLFHPQARQFTPAPYHFGRGIEPYEGFHNIYRGAIREEEFRIAA